MSSTLTVNFSLRQNKAIERSIAFDALRMVATELNGDPVYVGLGSVWFQDFRLAHRLLGVEKMISIERDADVFARAEFNRPFASIEMVEGPTEDVLPVLLDRDDLMGRPWIVWLDYDQQIDEDRLEELSRLIVALPDRSALLTTFNARDNAYAHDASRRFDALRELFGEDIVADDLQEPTLKGPVFMRALAQCVLDHLSARAVQSGRPGGFVPGIRLLYHDSVNMITVGGFLPGTSAASSCQGMVRSDGWCGFEDALIKTQPLTIREVQALCRLLPSDTGLVQKARESLGFNLSDTQLDFFSRHYLRYPTYAEIL
ncbi:MAG: hypothetical protein F4Z58_09040 [Acidimicrobiaceae bacterium]|nr:hypothetical protein [Acidimicrobiaceae bacterium]MYD07898.1 hypothetical protein [Acidimicrobiaceae bacterium]MYI59393.1 hypothetical protein [Acidimicrobiaceae bacterium]